MAALRLATLLWACATAAAEVQARTQPHIVFMLACALAPHPLSQPLAVHC